MDTPILYEIVYGQEVVDCTDNMADAEWLCQGYNKEFGWGCFIR